MKSQSTNLRAAEQKRNTQPAFVYFFQYETGGNFFYTNYDQDVPIIGATIFSDPQVFTSCQVSHNPFTEDTQSDTRPVTVQLPATDTELRKYFVTAPSQKISVMIFRLNSANMVAGQPVAFADLYLEFSGIAISVSFNGYVIAASFLPPVLREDQLLPTFMYQKLCNYQFCGKWCTLSAANFSKTTTIAAVNRSNKTIDIADTSTNIAGVSTVITAETFQGGLITDAAGNKIGIIACEILPSSAGTRLYLNWWNSPTVADSISVMAGCLKIPRTCDSYGNINNFGGTPCIPTTNPVINGIST